MTTPTTVNARFQLRADTAANWASVNPTLLTNELGLETDTKRLKIGDGSTAWNSLGYFPSIVSGGTVLGNLEIGTTGTLTFEGSTADGFETTLAVTDPTADRTITLPDQSGTVVVSGNASITDADIAANAEIAVSKLANGTANQVIVTDGTNVSWSDNLTLAGDLTVNGTTTTINTETLTVKDKNIELAVVDTPTDVTADGGGITLKGTTDKTINWVDATDAWTSSERFSVPLGSAGAPSLTFTGDANTGIYSPGADQLALSTSGVGRVFVDADGNVGAGAVSPSNTLHVYKNASQGGIGAPTTANAGLRVQDNANSLYMDGNAIFSDGAGRLDIATLQSTDIAVGTSNTERLRITSAGLVGIGTSSPSSSALLDVADRVAVAEGSAGTPSLHSRTDTNTGLNLVGTDRLSLVTAGSNRLFIDAAGAVGIGTSTFDTGDILHVSGSADVRLKVSTTSTSAGHNAAVRLDATTNGKFTIQTGADTSGGLRIYDNNASAERARIDSSGRLLVGTSSALSAGGNSQYGLIQVEGNSASGNGQGILTLARGTAPGSITTGQTLGMVVFSANNGGEYGEIRCEADGAGAVGDYPGRLTFSTTADGASSPTERMRISSTGQAYVVSTYYGATIISTEAAGTSVGLLEGKHSGTAGSITGATTSFTVWTNGNVVNTNNSYGAISDIKLKENIVDANPQWDDIRALQIRKYNFKEGQTHTQIGLVAQEVELVSPGLVSESPDRDEDGNDLGTVTKSVNYSVLYMKAVKALQEAMERIETLEARLTAAGI